MATAVESLNTKVSAEEKREFTSNAEALGLTPSAAIKVFIRMFNTYKGFPFELRRMDVQPSVTYLSDTDFKAFAEALDAPMAPEAQELLAREFSWSR